MSMETNLKNLCPFAVVRRELDYDQMNYLDCQKRGSVTPRSDERAVFQIEKPVRNPSSLTLFEGLETLGY